MTLHGFVPPEIRGGYLAFEIWTKRGLVERWEVLLERVEGLFPFLFP